MKPRPNLTQEFNSLFSYYPADLIEAALVPLMPASADEIDEHTAIQQLFYAELTEIIHGNLIAYQQTKANEQANTAENEALTDAKSIINILTPIIPIGYVFFQQGKLNSGNLTFVVDRYEYKPIDEVHQAVNFSLMAYPKITFEIHTYGTMVNLISNGHFYYATLCAQKNCIYQKKAHYNLPSPNPVLLAANRLNAAILFKQNSDKALSFMNGAKQYLERNENTMAVFMLQQACEFTYRGLIMVFKGKNIKSHELVMLRKQLTHYAPQVIGLFHPKPKKELRLLTFLQEAYIKARYENAYQIDQEQALELVIATSSLMKGVQTLFDDYLAETIC
ncbi:HEPN domain-containing protein [Pedobacter frigiditerrae]|uniref:HEPN domain-containing protein n=1 Tax=Pedobacter frigiditerrae TaxID=2530452 RepID=A0A4R0MTE3_9SPHI|nr:HEPN domain-containing protein [Pedobacter frigiditerrae]TCC90063.1 HEPN domain-containing protein [Pedobacter frigiditerrae]